MEAKWLHVLWHQRLTGQGQGPRRGQGARAGAGWSGGRRGNGRMLPLVWYPARGQVDYVVPSTKPSQCAPVVYERLARHMRIGNHPWQPRPGPIVPPYNPPLVTGHSRMAFLMNASLVLLHLDGALGKAETRSIMVDYAQEGAGDLPWSPRHSADGPTSVLLALIVHYIVHIMCS